MQYFLSGIGTDVGKTVASAILCKILNAAYWKPIQSGTIEGSDKATIQNLAPKIKCFPEFYAFKAVLSPDIAAKLEQDEIDLDKIEMPKHSGNLVVEGAGGLLVPVNDKALFIDWVAKMQWPIILVSRHYLGSINHTLLSIEYLKAKALPIAGLLFVGKENKATESVILKFANVPVLGRIEETDILDADFVQNEADRLKANVLKVLAK